MDGNQVQVVNFSQHRQGYDKLIEVTTSPRSGMNRQLKAIGASYGVMKFIGGAKDKRLVIQRTPGEARDQAHYFFAYCRYRAERVSGRTAAERCTHICK